MHLPERSTCITHSSIVHSGYAFLLQCDHPLLHQLVELVRDANQGQDLSRIASGRRDGTARHSRRARQPRWWTNGRNQRAITVATGDAEAMGHGPGVLHELRYLPQRVGAHTGLAQQAHPLVGCPGAEARGELGFQGCTGESLYSLQVWESGKALALRLLCAQKEPGVVGTTIQALQRPPACRLRPTWLIPDFARIALHIWQLQEGRGMA